MNILKPTIGFALMALIIGGLWYVVNPALATVPVATTTPPPSATSTLTEATYTMSDVALHSSSDNCWMAIDGTVYNVTAFIASKEHNPEILRGCGLDASAMFAGERKHTRGRAQVLLPGLAIGSLAS